MTISDKEPIAQSKLHWYRIPLDRAVLAELNQRSDAWGFAQTLGHLGIIAGTSFAPSRARVKSRFGSAPVTYSPRYRRPKPEYNEIDSGPLPRRQFDRSLSSSRA